MKFSSILDLDDSAISHPLSIFYPRFLDKANFGGGQKREVENNGNKDMGLLLKNKHSNQKIKGGRQ